MLWRDGSYTVQKQHYFPQCEPTWFEDRQIFRGRLMLPVSAFWALVFRFSSHLSSSRRHHSYFRRSSVQRLPKLPFHLGPPMRLLTVLASSSSVFYYLSYWKEKEEGHVRRRQDREKLGEGMTFGSFRTCVPFMPLHVWETHTHPWRILTPVPAWIQSLLGTPTPTPTLQSRASVIGKSKLHLSPHVLRSVVRVKISGFAGPYLLNHGFFNSVFCFH